MRISQGRHHRAVLAGGFILAMGVCSTQAGRLPDELGHKLSSRYITPAMAGFQQAAARMQEGLMAYCAVGDADVAQAAAASERRSRAAGDLDQRFGDLVQAWSGIAFLRFGPLVEDNRFERIFFWPDPRGVTLRQIQGQLAVAAQEGVRGQTVAGDPAAGGTYAEGREQVVMGASTGAQNLPEAKTGPGPTPGSILEPASLATHSVAIQGLPALEYMLYRDSGLLRPGAQGKPGFETECAYARAIAGNLAHIGSELSARWAESGAYAIRFDQPSADNPVYRSTQEVAGEAIKALSTGLQFARDIALAPMLGSGPQKANAKKAPFWRSGKFALFMAASAEAMLAFHDAGGYGYGADEAWIGTSIQGELRRAAQVFNSGASNAGAGRAGPANALAAYIGSEAGYRQYVLASLLLRNTKGIVDENMAPAFGARIGFNALDGD